ncbi:MAG: PQQ-binding-like beta-propeller repeat protein [Chitinophagaceae bacterium]
MPFWVLHLFEKDRLSEPAPDPVDSSAYKGWAAYSGTKDGMRYSALDQINRSNVQKLTVAWTFSSNDKDPKNKSQNQCNPIVVDGILYGTSPQLKLIALDAATGVPHWIFNPASVDSASAKDPFAFFRVSRGVMFWKDDKTGEKRIFYSVGSKTYAINANDGSLIRSFGENGFIELSNDLDREKDFNAFFAATTPGVIYKDLMIMGMRVAESADAAPGHVRAFDVRTGKRKWIFHTIPYPGEFGYETWPDKNAWKKLGGANNWSGMSLDENRGIVYIPTGSIGGDFYGGFRKGKNLFANSLIALDAATGKYLWHFQTVHHDLWDRDLAANPNLVTLYKDGKKIDVVAQITKHGYIFMFDRVTGKPVFPIKETPVPQNALPGESTWPTQPIPTLPEPFARQSFGEKDLSDIDSVTHAEMLKTYKTVKESHMFAPPSKASSWIFPGYDGGGEWGGAAVDPESGILYVNSSEIPWILKMVDIPGKSIHQSVAASGKSVYTRYCMSCHGVNLKGNGSSYPSLVNIGAKMDEDALRKIIITGKNMMPSLKQISSNDMDALMMYLLKKNDIQKKEIANNSNSKEPVSLASEKKNNILDEVIYGMTGYNRFTDKNGYPGIKPPWGTLNAVNLKTGKLLWKVPLGEFEELKQKGLPATGTQVYGGPVVTKGGLVFVASTQDEKIRAFDKRTGVVLWEAKLPAAGYATPSVYAIDGRQYVVIACGGGKLGSKSGDQYVAFALPEGS